MPRSQKSPKKPKQEKCYLQEVETNVLRELQVEWNKQPDKQSRDSFVTSTVLPKIQQLNKEKFGPEKISKCKDSKKLWDKRVKAIFGWFKNHKPYKDKAVFKVQRKLQLRWVVGRDRAAEVERLIKSTYPEVQRGDKAYPGCYQKCLTAYVNSLSKEDKVAFQEKRDKWQEQGPPMELRMRAAKKYSRKAIGNMHTMLHKEMNVHCLTFDFHPGEDGKMVLLCHDYVSALCGQDGGDKFLPFHLFDPTGYARVMNTVLEYTRYVRQRLEKKGDSVDEPGNGKFNTELILKGPGGLPLIPQPCLGVKGHEIAEILKDVVREYFTTHYRLATGRTSARPPWKAIGENPSAFFDPECIPPGFLFQDPSRMGQSVKKLVDHLRERQEEFGVNAFRFEHVAVSGLTELQPASYPLEVQAVIEAGKSVKDWPKAGDIPIDLRLSIVDENPTADKPAAEECSTDPLQDVALSIPQETESTTVPFSAKDELPHIFPQISDESRWNPTALSEVHRMSTNSESMDAISSTNQPLHEKGNNFIQAGMAASVISTGPATKSLIDGPSEMHVDETNRATVSKLALQPSTESVPIVMMDQPVGHKSVTHGGPEGHYAFPHPRVSTPNYINNNPDMNPPQPFHFAQHSMPGQYYIPVPQQIGAANPMSHQMPNPGLHPFMHQLVPDQWAYLQGHQYYPTVGVGPAKMSGDPSKQTIDHSLLPPGMPTFSFPSSHETFLGQPPPPFYGQTMTSAINGSPTGAPYSERSVSQAEPSALIPPKGTPSPKKSPAKRGRASAKPTADTPTRRRKPKT